MIGGILEGLLYTTTTEYDDCASYLTDQYDSLLETAYYFLRVDLSDDSDSDTVEGSDAFFDGINKIISVIYLSEDSFTNCWLAGGSAVDVYKGYNIITYYTDYLSQNAYLNFGVTYESIINLILFFQQDERSSITGAYTVGRGFGRIFSSILYPDDVTLAEQLPAIFG